MGIAFPMAEVISTYIPPSFYEVSTQGDMDLTSHSKNSIIRVLAFSDNEMAEIRTRTI
jgi:hypothetical protein